jgi:hypothetical protein
MNKRSCEFTTKGDVNMAEIKEAMPAPQPEALDMPDDEVLYELADLFRVFGDSTRIKILYALHDNELCVQDIANAAEPVGGEPSAAGAQGFQARAVPARGQNCLLRTGR